MKRVFVVEFAETRKPPIRINFNDDGSLQSFDCVDTTVKVTECILPTKEEVVKTGEEAMKLMEETNPYCLSYYIAGQQHIINKLNE
jgi:hypothetical protein